MAATEHLAEVAAIDWLVRQRDPAFDEWEAFTGWLEADPVHARAYHEAAAADRDLDALLAGPIAPEPLPKPVPRRAWAYWAGGGAVAAGLALAIGLAVRSPAPQPYVVATAPGERRVVELSPGTQIAMNGGTRVLLDRHAMRRASLERGQAVFTVRHEAGDPFEVSVAGTRVVDAGTTFEITRDEDRLDVAVAEGEVVVDPAGQRIDLKAGQALHRGPGGDTVRRQIATASVGEWRQNRLRYDGAPLATVAADLSRNLGIEVTADPAVATRPFRGVLILDGGPDAVAARVAPALGVRVKRSADSWRLVARP